MEKMSAKDYRLAYKFLQLRATKGGMEPFQVTDNLPAEQKERIYKFLSFNHQVKFI